MELKLPLQMWPVQARRFLGRSDGRSFIIVTIISLASRALLSLINIFYGINPIPFLPGASAWSDFYRLNGYELQLMHQGYVPYRDFGFSYTPLFIYAIYAFYAIGGIHFAAIPIVLADAGTASLIFLIVLTTGDRKMALIAGLLYALSPFALFNEAYLWLSSQPMVFFLLLSILLLRKDKPILSSFALGISILFKQEALFILPAYLTWYILRFRTEIWRGMGTMAGTLFAGSLPFLLISPVSYVKEISYNLLGKVTYSLNASTRTHSLVSSTIQACSSSASNLPTTGSYVLCGITYSWSPPIHQTPAFVIYSVLTIAASAASIPLLIMLSPSLYLGRNKTNALELWSAFSFTGFLVVFSLLIHVLFLYYFLPVYALLFASIRDRGTALIATVASILGFFVPDGTSIPIIFNLVSVALLLLWRSEGLLVLTQRVQTQQIPSSLAVSASNQAP